MSDHSFLIPSEVPFSNVDFCFSENAVKLSENRISSHLSPTLAVASKLQHSLLNVYEKQVVRKKGTYHWAHKGKRKAGICKKRYSLSRGYQILLCCGRKHVLYLCAYKGLGFESILICAVLRFCSYFPFADEVLFSCK